MGPRNVLPRLRPRQHAPRHAGDPRKQRPQLVHARHEPGTGLLAELPERGGERAVQLERGVGEAPVVEVEPRAEGELLAQQLLLARTEQLRQALLRA